jgi:hypothetical protein
MKKPTPSPQAYDALAPELREWLCTQVRILAYWDSLPASHFTPPIPPKNRAKDRSILRGLRRLLA